MTDLTAFPPKGVRIYPPLRMPLVPSRSTIGWSGDDPQNEVWR